MKKNLIRCSVCLVAIFALVSISWASYITQISGKGSGSVERWYFADVDNSMSSLNLFNKNNEYLTADSFGEGIVKFTLKEHDNSYTNIPVRVKIKVDTSQLFDKVNVYDDNDNTISYQVDATVPLIFRTSFVGAVPETLENEKDKNLFNKWLTIDAKNITIFDYVLKPGYKETVSVKIEWKWNSSYYIKNCECDVVSTNLHIKNPDMGYRTDALKVYENMLSKPNWESACFSKYFQLERYAKLLSKPQMYAGLNLIGEQYIFD